MFDLAELERAHELVGAAVPPTPAHAWPLLAQRLGTSVVVKHENHTPIGAFKVRGGLTYLDRLKREQPDVPGIISATRGNHGQSLAFAARRAGVPATIYVPSGNSVEKNRAMRAFGATLVEHGEDFQAAREHAAALAAARGAHMVPSFHADLVRGVASYWMEFFGHFTRGEAPEAVFVPIGLGSGICACAAARAATGVATRIVGVVSSHAEAYRLSFEAGRSIEAPVSTQLADGMACRVPEPNALAIIHREVDEIVSVSDEEVAQAMRVLFADTHNVAEGAGAASLAALLQQRERWAGQRVGIVLSGGNVDSAMFAQVLSAR